MGGTILRAIEYYYLDKISDPDDLKKVMDQLDAIGISRGKWTHEFKKEEWKKVDEVEEKEIGTRRKVEVREGEIKLDVGDEVVANRLADGEYFGIKEGWIGRVAEIKGGLVRVKGEGLMSRGALVNPKHFDLVDHAEKEPKFKVGDEVIANDEIEDEPIEKGWKGKIIQVDADDENRDILVGGQEDGDRYWVSSKYFDLATPAEEKAGSESGPEKLEGRDAEKFLNEVFTWSEANTAWNSRRAWNWRINTGFGFVKMLIDGDDTKRLASAGFIDSTESVDDYPMEKYSGINNLIKMLEGKKVISVMNNSEKGRGDEWYLKIIR